MRVNHFNSNTDLSNNNQYATAIQFTGPLVLHADPIDPMHAATKRYVDLRLGSGLNADNIQVGTIPVDTLPAFSGDFTNQPGTSVFTLNSTGVAEAIYTKVRVDAKGRVVEASHITHEDVPGLSWNKVNTLRPNTLAGYGITDGIRTSGDSLIGSLKITGFPVLPKHAITREYVDILTAQLNTSELPGTVIRKAYPNPPATFIRANGAVLEKAVYPGLYAAIGDKYSSTSGKGNGNPWSNQYEFNTQQTSQLGSWFMEEGEFLPSASYRGYCFTIANKVYVIANSDSTAHYTRRVYMCDITQNGELVNWVESDPIPEPRHNSTSFVHNNYFYILGGGNSSAGINDTRDIIRAKLNNDGTIGAWEVVRNVLPSNIAQQSTVVIGNRLLIVGGYVSSNAYTSTCRYADFTEEGDLVNFTTAPSLPEVLARATPVVIGSFVYLIGGASNPDTGSVHSKVFRAPILANGDIGTWTQYGTIPYVTANPAVVATKNRVYVIGGTGGLNSPALSNVISAPINSDSSLGSWVNGVSLPVNRGGAIPLVTSSRLYLLGGAANPNHEGRATRPIWTAFSGGLNNYDSYTDGSMQPLEDETKFRIMDLTPLETNSAYYFVKAR